MEAEGIERELEQMGLTHGADFFNTELEPKKVDIVDGVGFLVADRMT